MHPAAKKALEALHQVVAGFQYSAPGAGHRVLEQLGPWVSELSLAAMPRWLPRLLLSMPCHVVLRTPEADINCHRSAVGPCMLCKKAACLSHAFVAQTGDIVCFACAFGQARKNGPPPPGTETPPRARAPEAPTPNEIQFACAVLGVSGEPSWQAAQAAYRQRVKTAHPDQGGTDEEFRRVQAAYELLKTAHEAGLLA